MLSLYSSIVQSHLTYCVEVWGNCCLSFLSPIIIAQKRAVRMICGLKSREHTSKYFKEVNILKFQDMVEAKIKVLMYKAWKLHLPDSLQSLFFTKSSDKYYTRKRNNFKVKYCNSKIKSNCLSIIGVRLWNEMEDSMKNCNSLIKFKKMVKQSYLKKY